MQEEQREAAAMGWSPRWSTSPPSTLDSSNHLNMKSSRWSLRRAKKSCEPPWVDIDDDQHRHPQRWIPSIPPLGTGVLQNKETKSIRVWPIGRGCSLLHGTWSYLYFFKRSVIDLLLFCNHISVCDVACRNTSKQYLQKNYFILILELSHFPLDFWIWTLFVTTACHP